MKKHDMIMVVKASEDINVKWQSVVESTILRGKGSQIYQYIRSKISKQNKIKIKLTF